MDDITLVIPAKNESESLPQVLDDLIKFKLKTIIVLEKEDIKTIESINKYGIVKGTTLSFKRILKCHPFTSSKYDPVPKRKINEIK